MEIGMVFFLQGQHLSQSTQIGGASSQYATTGGRGKRGSGRSKDRLTIPAPAPLPQRHNSDLSLSTIAEESSFASQSSYHRAAAAAAAPQSTQYPQHHHHYPYQQHQPSPYLHQHHPQMGQTGSAPTSGGQPQHQQPTSVFVEPHVVVETTTYPNSANVSCLLFSRIFLIVSGLRHQYDTLLRPKVRSSRAILSLCGCFFKFQNAIAFFRNT